MQTLLNNLRAARARAYVRVIGTNRELSWLVFDILLPVLSISAYVFIYKAIGAPEEYGGYVIIGGVMTGFWLNVLWNMGANWYWEKQTGNLEIFFLAPISRLSILGGMAVGGMFQTSIRAMSTAVLGALIFRIPMQVAHPFGALVAFVLTLVALYGLGAMFASLFLLYGREAWHYANLLQEPIYLLSGFYFPVRALGFWVAVGASVIPLTLGLDAMRQLVYPHHGMGLLPVGVELAILAGLCALYVGMAGAALRAMENLARREGRLTLKWQ